VRELSQVNGYRSTAYLTLQWWLIIGSLFAAGASGHPVVYLASGVVIASCLQGLGVLMHDAAHYLLYKNRAVNDVVSDLFISFPIGMSTTLYRRTHFRHHRFTNTDEDQDWAAQREEGEWFEWPKTRWGCLKTLMRSLFGMNFHRGWILYKHWSPWYNLFTPVTRDFPLRARILYVLSTAVVYVFFVWAIRTAPAVALSLMALYLFSGLTLLNLINRMRATAEHVGTEQQHELNSTRTVIPNWWERLLIARWGVNYHIEHHLYPSVPGCNLAELHATLMQDEEYRSGAHITRSYVGVVRELMNKS
jgi:fatty acid desaturase